MSKKQNFVNIYNEFRDLELNKEYYSRKAQKIKKRLKMMDVFLACFATGSAVGGLKFWDSIIFGIEIGPILLASATTMAVIIGVARPYLKMEDEHERLSSIQGAYSAIAFVMNDVVRDVKTNQNVSEIEEALYRALRQVRGSLQPKEDSPPDSKLIDEMQELVNRRHPQTEFYYPPET